MAMGIKSITVMAIGAFLIAILMPFAIGTIANANTTNWDSSVVTIFQVLLPILAVLGLALAFIPRK